MSRIFSFLVFILLFVARHVEAQQLLRGVVIDNNTHKPIENVTITIDGTRLGTITDTKGFFEIEMPEIGPWKVRFAHISYDATTVSYSKNINGKAIKTTIWLRPASIEISPVEVTSDRIQKSVIDVPARMSLIDQTTIDNSAANNVDELLKSIPGIYVNRSWGMYSRNASVTMRGLSSSSRVLVMLDDIPLNKSGGGGVNWNLLPNGAFERIEVFKGPASSLYGNNAMTGIINVISGSNSSNPHAAIELLAAQNNTFGFSSQLSTSLQNKKPFAWLSISGIQGDGYFLDPIEIRNEYSSKSYLKQYNAYLKTGYIFSDSARIEVSALASSFVSGLGTTVFEPDGNFDDFTSWMGSVKYYLQTRNTSYKIVSFANYEDYFNQSESINSYAEYKLSFNPTKKIDAGIWTTFAHNFNKRFEVIGGLDYKYAIEDGKTLYLTASDEIYFFGMHNFVAAFVQTTYQIGNKYTLQTGLRCDFGQYSHGEITVINPTALSDFLIPYLGKHPTSHWSSLSPKIALKYKHSDKLNAYASLSKGFMPPTIDDMTRSGKIRKGIKLANPNLLPEILYNAELGFQWLPNNRIIVEPSIYYSIAENMIYQVWTGDSVEILSDGPKPMIQKRNVSIGTVMGTELSIIYHPFKWLNLQLAYAYNNSKIKDYNALEGDLDLSGLYMAEVPKNLFSVDLRLKYKVFILTTEYRFTDEIFADDENSQIIDANHVVNISFNLRYPKYNIALTVNDVFDTEFIDRKGLLSPGRFFAVKVKYTIL